MKTKLNRYIPYLESTLPSKILRDSLSYFIYNDRIRHLIGRSIIQKALKDFKISESVQAVKHSNYGKPYIRHGLNFSVSHSNQLVVCVCDPDHPVGVDAEYIDKCLDWRRYKEFLHSRDSNLIENSNEKLRSFFYVWTRMESIVKADGRGLTLNTEQIEQTDDFFTIAGDVDQKKWHTKRLELREDYMVSVCSTEIPNTIKTIPLTFQQAL